MGENAELPEEVKIFLVESYENLDQLEQDLLSLEKAPANTELLNKIFRAVHTIKGNSGFLGFNNLEMLCHKGEAILDRARAGKLSQKPEVASLLLEFIDAVRTLLNEIESGAESSEASASLLTRLGQLL